MILADIHPTPLKFAVVGGGISGLTAAYRLTKLLPQAHVEIFEASDRLGGVLATHHDGDFLVERGADSFFTKQPWAVELCEELGLSDEIIPTNSTNRRALVLHQGKLHPVPAGFVLTRPQLVSSILKTPLLSWRGKLRLLAERWVRRPRDLEQDQFDDNLAHFATERLGREAFERLVEPLVAGIYTADANQLSVAATMPEAITALREHGTLWHLDHQGAEVASGARYGSFVSLRGGVGQLVTALAKYITENSRNPSPSPSPPSISSTGRGGGLGQSLHLNASIASVARDEHQSWLVQFADGTSRGPYAGVVLALPTPCAATLIDKVDPQLAELLGRIRYASSAVVILAFRQDQIERKLDGFGFVVPQVENREIVAASFSSIKFPGRVPSDMVVIRVFLGGALRPELVQLPEAELERIALAELRHILGIRGEPTQVDIVKWREKMPQYHVGHVQLVNAIEDRANQHEGLAFAGNGYRGVGIPYCVRSGDNAARRLAERFLT